MVILCHSEVFGWRTGPSNQGTATKDSTKDSLQKGDETPVPNVISIGFLVPT